MMKKASTTKTKGGSIDLIAIAALTNKIPDAPCQFKNPAFENGPLDQPDILCVVFSYLSIPEIGKASMVCKRWRHAGQKDTLWQELARLKKWTVEPEQLKIFCGSHKYAFLDRFFNSKFLFIENINSAGYVGDVVEKVERVSDFKLKTINTKDFEKKGITPAKLLQKRYRAILISSYFSYASDFLGNYLADYVDLGGNVVICYEANVTSSCILAGRFLTDKYFPMQPSSQLMGGSIQRLDFGHPEHQADHPIFKNVNTFSGGTLSYRCHRASFNQGAFPIGYWTDGTPLVIIQGYNSKYGGKPTRGIVVELNIFPVSTGVDQNPSSNPLYDQTTDGDWLISNCLAFAARGKMTP